MRVCMKPALCTVLIITCLFILQTRTEPATCNNETNKTKRKQFAEELVAHEHAGNYIIYCNETNFNLYCKRTQGHAEKDTRATVMVPPPKGPNLQIECAVSTADGVLIHRLERGSIKMQQNADFVEAVYTAAKASPTYQELIAEHDDMVLLRLAPYSSMCNPIEGCFSVLKASIKRHLALHNKEMVLQGDYPTMAARRMALLEDAAVDSMSAIIPRLVFAQYGNLLRAAEAARRFEDMQYGN